MITEIGALGFYWYGWTQVPQCPTWASRSLSTYNLSSSLVFKFPSFVLALYHNAPACPGWWCAHITRAFIYINTTSLEGKYPIGASLKGEYTPSWVQNTIPKTSGYCNFYDGKSFLPDGPPPTSLPPTSWFVSAIGSLPYLTQLYMDKTIGEAWDDFEIEFPEEYVVTDGGWTRLVARWEHDNSPGTWRWGIYVRDLKLTVEYQLTPPKTKKDVLRILPKERLLSSARNLTAVRIIDP